MRRFIGVLALALFVLPAAGAAGLVAQTVEWDPRTAEVTREDLTELLARLEASATAPGYSDAVREQAAREAAFVRARLENGDFQAGDRIVLHVAGEEALSDTMTVTADRQIRLPQIGDISLAGILRSELQGHLEQELGRYLRDPVIQAAALIRIAILGAVGQQGFYTIPATALIADALMVAGGPAAAADIDALTIERGDRILWEGDALQNAVIEGWTLDQLGLRAGDRILVPEDQPGLFEGGLLRTLLVTLPPLIYFVLRVVES